jgi:xylulokinase
MSIFLGIDSGTQGVKAVALDLDSGRVVAEARAPHRLIAGLPAGHMEQHPRDWVAALDRVLREVCATIDRSRVRGIGVSGQQHGFVPLDADRQVIRPAKLWCDTSTTEECARITAKLGGLKGAVRHTGNAILPGYTAPKILWLKRREPAHYRRLRHVLLPHDFLNFHLTGRLCMEAGDASGTALLDVRRRDWSRPAIEAIDPGLADWLPPLIDARATAGLLRTDLAATYRLRPDVYVSAGGGDNMMGAIGTGNVVPGVVTASLGTSGTIYAHAARPVVDPQGEIAAFCDSTGGWLPLLCTMNVTTVTEAVRGLLELDHAGLDRAVAGVPAGAGGLAFLPYLAGERTPNVPNGTGVLFGLTGRTVAEGHLARAAMEGVALGLNYGLRRLNQLGVRPKEIRLTGGGSKSRAWRQIMADVFQVPVVAMQQDEGAALGGALQAAWCVSGLDGRLGSLAKLASRVVALDPKTRCEPRKAHAALYRDLQGIHDELSVTLRPLFDRHRRLVTR